MRLATRCPACGTTFMVVRDQLRISDGWVRCGRCSHVFDGGEHLHESPSPKVTNAPSTESGALEQPAPVAPPAPVPDMPVHQVHAESPSSALADVDFFSDTLLRLSGEALPSGGYAASPLAPLPTITDHIPQPPRSQPVALDTPSLGWPAFTHYAPASTVPVIEFPLDAVVSDPSPAFLCEDDGWSRLPSLHLGEIPRPPLVVENSDEDAAPPVDADDAQFQNALRRARIKSLKIARARGKTKDGGTPSVVLTPSESAIEPAPPIEAVGMTASRPPGPNGATPVSRSMRSASSEADTSAPRRLRWRLPLRVAAVIASVLLLGAQVLHQERNAIVARQPSLRPIFATACEWLGCQLSALRRIADIRIDGASFARDKSGEGYQFSFTLRNLASIPLAMPAVELSLLDTQERTVVRRVLRPADYGAPATLAAHAERATALTVTLAGEDAAALPRVAGFRLDAFYP